MEKYIVFTHNRVLIPRLHSLSAQRQVPLPPLSTCSVHLSGSEPPLSHSCSICLVQSLLNPTPVPSVWFKASSIPLPFQTLGLLFPLFAPLACHSPVQISKPSPFASTFDLCVCFCFGLILRFFLCL